jgi:hypothetical protein
VEVPWPVRYLTSIIKAIICRHRDHYVNQQHPNMFTSISFTDRGRVVQACRDCQLGWWILWRGLYILTLSFLIKVVCTTDCSSPHPEEIPNPKPC